ncbi:fungal fruit body lectin [Kalaharituber pfeilii]|nr:fungal fruit body lectin [Kalaharituber pfeilii]
MPPYTISIRIYQTDPSLKSFFHVVEEGCWWYGKYCRWSECNGEYILHMGESGTSGGLRLITDTGRRFIVFVGVHNYKRWCDILTRPYLKEEDTVCKWLHKYYESGTSQAKQREKQLSEYSVCDDGDPKIKYTIKFTQSEGEHLKADLIIGPCK